MICSGCNGLLVERRKLRELPQSMMKRAVLARELAVAAPEGVQVDDELLPWVYSEDDERWYSFDGNYSASSPEQKRQREIERQESWAEREAESEKVALAKFAADLHWSKIREAVLERDEFTCYLCDKVGDSRLHIHHVMKRAKGGTDHLDNLVAVCSSCHPRAETIYYNPAWV